MCTARCRVKDQHLKFSPESHILYFIKVFFYKEHSKLPRKIKIRSPVKKMFWILNCKELHTVCQKCFKSPQTFIFFRYPPFSDNPRNVGMKVISHSKKGTDTVIYYDKKSDKMVQLFIVDKCFDKEKNTCHKAK